MIDIRTGELYLTPQEAVNAGVPSEHIVELFGSRESIESVAGAVKTRADKERKAKRKAARASRKRNTR